MSSSESVGEAVAVRREEHLLPRQVRLDRLRSRSPIAALTGVHERDAPVVRCPVRGVWTSRPPFERTKSLASASL